MGNDYELQPIDLSDLESVPGLKDSPPLGEESQGIDLSDIPTSTPSRLKDLYNQIRTNPDTEGKVIEFATKTGLPADTVRNRLQEAERIASEPDWDSLERENPALAKQLSEDLELFRLAQDKETIDGLNTLGKLLHQAAQLAPEFDVQRTAELTPGAFQASIPALGANMYRFAARATGLYQDALRGVGIEPWEKLDIPERFWARQAERSENVAEGLRGDRTGLPATSQAFLQGIESIPQSAASLAAIASGVPVGVSLVSLFGVPTAGEALQEAKKAGLSGWESVLYATEMASSEVMSEMIPGLKFLGDIKAGAPLWKTLMHQAVNETWTEEVNLALQEFSTWAHLTPDKPFSEFAEEFPEKAYMVAVATMTTVGGSTTIGAAIAHASGMYGSDQGKVQYADAWRNRLREIAQVASESTLRERAPQKFEQVIDTMLRDAGTDSVYVNANEFNEYFQSLGENPLEAAAALGVQDQLAEATIRNGDLKIPAAQLIANVGKGDTVEGMIDIMRPTYDAMSAKEAEQWQKTQGKKFDQLAQQIEKQHETDTAWQQSADQVQTFIRDQIAQTGAFDEETAGKYATLHRSFAQVIAGRLGIQPHQVYERFGLRVAGSAPGGAGTVLEQGTGALQDLWDQYDDTGEITFEDLVDEVEALVEDGQAPEGLTEAIRAYRQEQRDDLELGGRGDMDTAEENFSDALRLYLGGPTEPGSGATLNQGPKKVYEPQVPSPRSNLLILPHGRVELEMQAAWDRAQKAGTTLTSRRLANVFGAPSKRKGKDDLDVNVRPTGYDELKKFLEWSIKNDHAGAWYDEFGKGFVDLVGEANLQEASIVFGITSSQNSAEVNLSDTLHVMSIARRFNPVDKEAEFREALRSIPRTGGQRLKISGDQIDRIVKSYQTGTYEGGLKVSTYMQVVRARGLNQFNPYSVQDVHMARVFGYRYRDIDKKTGQVVDSAKMPSNYAIRYGMWLTSKLGEEYGLRPDKVQAYLWFYGKMNLSPKKPAAQLELEGVEPGKVGSGTFESATRYSQAEIDVIHEQIAEGLFDTRKALTQALTTGAPPHHRSKVLKDPYSNVDLNEQLEALAEARAPRALVSANPGTTRGYGFPEGTSIQVLQRYNQDVLDAITDKDGQIRVFRDLGIVHKVRQTLGTWEGVEPTLEIVFPGETMQTAELAAKLLGHALMQDAVVTEVPKWEGTQYGILLQKQDGSEFSNQDVADLYDKLNPEHKASGIQFTMTGDRTGLKFLDSAFWTSDDYTQEMLLDFQDRILGAAGQNYRHQFFTQESSYADLTRGSEGVTSETWDHGITSGSPTLQRTAIESLYKPVQAVYRTWQYKLGFQPANRVSPLSQAARGVGRDEKADRAWNAAAGLPVDSEGLTPLSHYSRVQGLRALDPNKFGTAAAGQEKARVGPDFLPRTYYGLPGYRKEPVLAGANVEYQTSIDPASLYDWDGDPLALRAVAATEHPRAGTSELMTLKEQAIKAAGYAGYWGRNGGGPVAVLFEPLEVREVSGPEYAQQNRGAIRFAPDITQAPSVIALLENADLSTFLHETGHFFFEVYRDLAGQPGADPQIRADMDALLKFVGVQDLEAWNALTPDQRRAGHEQVAEAFEQYLFGGEAPSIGLRKLFQTFSAWLRHVYRALGGPGARLTDDVKQVFDRMLATEEEIQAAETMRQYLPLFESADQAGMTPEEWTDYQALGSQATEQAIDAVQRRSLRDLQLTDKALSKEVRRLQREVASKRAEVRNTANEMLLDNPVYAAMRYLTHGDREPPAGNQAQKRLAQELAMQGHKLSKTALLDMYGDGPAAPWRYLSTGKYGLMAQDGIHPNELAELFGFGTNAGDTLVRALLDAKDPQLAVEELTTRLMVEKYGDLTTPERIREAAEEAVHSDARLRSFATELRALDALLRVRGDTGRQDAKGRKITYNILGAAAKAYAEKSIGRKTVADAPRTAEYQAAEIRAGKAALEAMQADDIALAAEHKRAQLLNAHFHRAATQAGQDIDKALRFLKKFERPGVRKKLSQDYLDQIDQLLERYDLRKSVTKKDIRERANIKTWIEQQEAQGLVPAIPQKVIDAARKQHYSTLPLDDFLALRDAIKSIDHLGRLKKKLLTAKDKREFDAIIMDAVASIEQHARKTIPPKIETDLPKDKLAKSIGGFFASHRKLAEILQRMDGFQDGGAMWRLMMRPLNDASAHEAILREKSTVELTRLFTELHSRGKLYQVAESRNGAPAMTRMGRLMVALNLGNEVNRQRLIDGYKWSPNTIGDIVAPLTKEDWDFVQAIWDHINSFWPDIEAKELRVAGVAPQKVEATPVPTPFGEYRGGYFPIKYDQEQSVQTYKEATAEAAKQALRGAFARATTRRGHLEARQEKVQRPVMLSFSVIFEHLEQVIHDLALHEYLIDATRVINDTRIQDAILRHYGPETYRQINSTITDVAAGDVPATNMFESGMNWLRTGASIAGMGWKLTTASLQPLGLTQSISRIGAKWVGRGLSRWIRSSNDMEGSLAWVQGKSEFMRLRAKTMQREINEVRNRITKESWFQDQLNRVARMFGKDAAPDFAASYFWLITRMQLVADMPTWLGQYEKSMAAGRTDEQASAEADQAVLDSQGGGQVKDLAQIQRGGPLLKLWTNFYSYFNVTYNRNVSAVQRTDFRSPKSIGHLASDMVMINVLPSVLASLMYELFRGKCEGDPECIGNRIAREQVSYALGAVVGLRELTSAFTGYGYEGPAGVRFMAAVADAAQQVAQGDIDEAALKSINNAAGILFHYPAGQVEYTAQGIYALMAGESENPAAVAFGAPNR